MMKVTVQHIDGLRFLATVGRHAVVLCAQSLESARPAAPAGGAKGGAMDKLVCVYAGDGAVLARDVEVALDKLEMPPYHMPNARTIGLFVWHNIKLRA